VFDFVQSYFQVFRKKKCLIDQSVTLYFTTRKQLCKYTENTVYFSVIIVYFRVSTREQYVKFGVIKG